MCHKVYSTGHLYPKLCKSETCVHCGCLYQGVGESCLADCQFVIPCFLEEIIEENQITFPVTLWWQGLSSGLKEKQALQQV